MAMPTGIGSGNGKGLAGQAIMAMAKVWLTCLPVPPPPAPPSSDGRGLAAADGARCPCLSDWCGLCGCSARFEAARRCGKGVMMGCGGLGAWVTVDGGCLVLYRGGQLENVWQCYLSHNKLRCAGNSTSRVGIRQDDIQAKLLVAVP